MYYIVAVQGCLPYISLVTDEREWFAKGFKSQKSAERYAKKHCAWAWRVVKF